MNKKHNLYLYISFLMLFFLGNQSVAQKYSVEECKEIALKNSWQISISNEQLKSAKHLRRLAFSNFFPEIEFTASYVYMNKPIQALQDDISTGDLINELPGDWGALIPDFFNGFVLFPADRTQIGQHHNHLFNFSLKQPIFAGGKILESYKMSKVMADLMQVNADLDRHKLLYEIEELYWNLVNIEEQEKLVLSYHNMLKILLKDMEAYYSQGIIVRNDLLRVQVKLNELDLSLFKIQNGRKLAKMALAQKMGIDINSPIEVSDEGLKDPSGEISPSEYKLENVVSRPELRLLQNNVKISESAFRIAKGSFLPTIGVGANYFFMNPNIHRGIANEFTNDYIFAFQVSVPIFHAFQKHHMYNLTKSNLLVAQSKLQDAHQQIALEYIMVSNELEETIKQIQITKLTMEQANENLRISQDRFNEGALQTRDLLEAQALWQEAQSHYIEAKAQYNTLLLKQKKASGQIE